MSDGSGTHRLQRLRTASQRQSVGSQWQRFGEHGHGFAKSATDWLGPDLPGDGGPQTSLAKAQHEHGRDSAALVCSGNGCETKQRHSNAMLRHGIAWYRLATALMSYTWAAAEKRKWAGARHRREWQMQGTATICDGLVLHSAPTHRQSIEGIDCNGKAAQGVAMARKPVAQLSITTVAQLSITTREGTHQ